MRLSESTYWARSGFCPSGVLEDVTYSWSRSGGLVVGDFKVLYLLVRWAGNEKWNDPH